MPSREIRRNLFKSCIARDAVICECCTVVTRSSDTTMKIYVLTLNLRSTRPSPKYYNRKAYRNPRSVTWKIDTGMPFLLYTYSMRYRKTQRRYDDRIHASFIIYSQDSFSSFVYLYTEQHFAAFQFTASHLLERNNIAQHSIKYLIQC
jgi:hypothetical protein